MKCDYCNNEVELVGGDVIYPHRPDLYRSKYYYCANDQAWVGCHPGTTKPLGRLANAELRLAKQQAHAVFDPLWRDTGRPRRYLYHWLAIQLGISKDDCHIGMFDVEQCQRVVEICRSAVQDREAMGE